MENTKIMKMNEMESFYRDKSILVAGGNGFVGINLISKLIDLGARVRTTIYNNEPQIKFDGVEYLRGDLQDNIFCKQVTRNMDFVFMAAANSSGAAVIEKTPLVHLTPNAIMNTQLLSAAYENNIKKYCFISSNTVYPLTDFAVSEKDVNYDLFEKYFVVGWMKIFSEKMCEMYSTKISKPMATLIVRPGNLFGPFDKFSKSDSKVVASLIRKALEGQSPLEVWGDGNDIKDFLFIDDFISGLLQSFTLKGDFSVFNIASGDRTSIRDLLEVILRKTLNLNLEVIYDSTKPTMIPKRMIDISKIVKEVGWVPEISLESGVEKTITWYKNFFHLRTSDNS
jgi:GDP-L-fucose synthase